MSGTEIFQIILAAIPQTVALTLISFLIGMALGVPICLLRVSRFVILRFFATSTIIITRSIPPILWIFLAYFSIGSGIIDLGPFAAASLALGLITGVNMAEVYRGSFYAIHAGQFEAAHVLNLPLWSKSLDVIGPQMVRVSIPSAATYLIGLLKNSAIASIIGVGEIMFVANRLAERTYQGLEIFAIAGLLYIMISVPVATVARSADTYLRAKVAR